jgi:hypothetical protein
MIFLRQNLPVQSIGGCQTRTFCSNDDGAIVFGASPNKSHPITVNS